MLTPLCYYCLIPLSLGCCVLYDFRYVSVLPLDVFSVVLCLHFFQKISLPCCSAWQWPFWPVFPLGGGTSQLVPDSWCLAALLKGPSGGPCFCFFFSMSSGCFLGCQALVLQWFLHLNDYIFCCSNLVFICN